MFDVSVGTRVTTTYRDTGKEDEVSTLLLSVLSDLPTRS